jgi:hypothetical protein
LLLPWLPSIFWGFLWTCHVSMYMNETSLKFQSFKDVFYEPATFLCTQVNCESNSRPTRLPLSGSKQNYLMKWWTNEVWKNNVFFSTLLSLIVCKFSFNKIVFFWGLLYEICKNSKCQKITSFFHLCHLCLFASLVFTK